MKGQETMKKLIGFTKGAMVGILLSAGALTLAVTNPTAPAAHAAQPPQISALAQGGSARVWGFGFTPFGTVRVQLLDNASHIVATRYLTAMSNGQLPWTQITTSHVGPVKVVASKLSCVRIGIRYLCFYSTESTTSSYVYAAPHLDQVYGERASVVLWGSGFTPGSRVQLEVLDAALHVLDIKTVTADNSNTYLRGTIQGEWLQTGNYSGKVYVVADGSPGESNWVSLSVRP
jgi:hypothetical protein